MTTFTPRYSFPRIEASDNIKQTGSPTKLGADINRVSDRAEVVIAGVDEKATSSVAAAENAKQAADAAAARNLLQDILLAQNDLRIRALEAMGALSPGSVTDGTIASTVNNSASLTREALGSAFVARGTIVHDVRDYGAKGDNATDDSAAFTAAIAAAKATRGRAYAYGTFRLDQPIVVDSNADFGDATVNYYGAGIAITITGVRLKVTTPRELWNSNKTYGGGWGGVAGSIGVRMLNTNGCEVRVPFVANFEEGLSVYGSDGGAAYNTVYLGWLFNNKRNQVLDTYSSTGVGYSNQNTYIGGRLSHNGQEGVNVEGVFSIFSTGAGDGGPNNNVWLNPCIEGSTAQYAWNFDRARNNRIIQARVEYGNAGRFGAASSRNEITVGYSNAEFVIVREPGSQTNDVIFPNTQQLQNKIVEHWNPEHTFPWLSMNWGSRKLWLGNGGSQGASLQGANGYLTCEGGIRPEATGTRDLGTGALRWRNVFADYSRTYSSHDYVASSSNAPATADMARVFSRKVGGKVQLVVQMPTGSPIQLAMES